MNLSEPTEPMFPAAVARDRNDNGLQGGSIVATDVKIA